MSLILKQTAYAIGNGLTASFGATGGTAPYVYSVKSGSYGSIVSSSGVYTAPALETGVQTIVVTDSLSDTAEAGILVGTPLELFCDIIRREMNLSADQVYLWDQKFTVPTDERLYVAVGMSSLRPFGKTMNFDPTVGLESVQSVNMLARLDVNIMSRSFEAVSRKEEVVLALGSVYAQQQQVANSFYIAPLPNGFVNLSDEDGPAIPYRFVISVNMQYAYRKRKAVEYFDSFELDSVLTEP